MTAPETAVAAYTEHAIIPAGLEDYTGFDGIGMESIVIPRMKIVQATSEEGRQGTFALNLTGEEFEEMDVVVIRITRGRVRWDPEETRSETPLCRSFDSKAPDSAIKNPPSALCDECPKSRWIDGEKPECSETYNLLCLLTEQNYMPFWVSTAGMSIKPTKKFISNFVLRGWKLWQYGTALSLKKMSDSKGVYYVIQFAPPRRLSNDVLQDIALKVVEFKDQTFQQTVESEEAVKESEDASNGAAADDGIETPDWVNEQ